MDIINYSYCVCFDIFEIYFECKREWLRFTDSSDLVNSLDTIEIYSALEDGPI